MTTVWAISGGEVAAWVAALAGVTALATQTINALRKRKKEQSEIEEALSHSPEVRHQLELGNVGEAVKHLNFIIETQGTHIARQAERLTHCDGEIERLRDREEALEAEAEGWQTQYRALEAKYEREVSALRKEIAEMKRNYARTLARLQGNNEPGEMT